MKIINLKYILFLFLIHIYLPGYGESLPYNKLVIKNNIIQISYEFMDKASTFKEQEITHLVTNAFEIYQNVFGGLPRDKKGNKYADFTIRVSQERFLGGEADPQIIILAWSENTLFGYANWKTLLLHELFHLWSAESIRYKDGYEQWFNEGFTEYYAYKTAVQLNLYTPEEAVSLATTPIGYYLSSEGLGQLSMREAGKDSQSKMDNYFLVYNGGWVAAMILDYDIRSKTQGKKNLDDLMGWLYKNFKRHEKQYTINNIVEGIKAVTGLDYHVFFTEYIIGYKPIPITNYFDLGKLAWDLAFNKNQLDQHKYILETLGIEMKQNKD